ncbi:MAG: HAMP domain-containing histidine kinase [Propionibacteriaceae bacterium]|nr:HAMP domain-containing histidine kinase [Propionibacteriaceae bacterium]
MIPGFLRRAAQAVWTTLNRSLRGRLIFLSTLAVGLGALLSGTAVYQVARQSLFIELDEELLAVAGRMAVQIGADLGSSTGFNADSLEPENVSVLLLNANRTLDVILGEQELVVEPTEIAIARLRAGRSHRSGLRADGVEYRIVAVPVVVESTNEGYALILGRELGPTMATLRTLSWMQWIAGLIGMLFGALSGLVLARASLQSIYQLSRGVAEITKTDSLAQVEVQGVDEVAELSRSFNAMVSSLGVARERQRRLIADASHELRTPLTSLRTNVELLIADESTGMLPPGARAETLRDIAEQLGEFTALIGDLVALSREEGVQYNQELVDFSAVVSQAVARAHRRGPHLVFDVDLEPWLVTGDPAMLERAVTNLLDNAVKFSPESGRVTVRLRGGELRIADQGSGIDEKDLPHIFDRFYRSDSSRNTPGTGLGLSIVDHTVTAHGGEVMAGPSRDGGAEFIVRLPAAEPDLESPASPSEPIG